MKLNPIVEKDPRGYSSGFPELPAAHGPVTPTMKAIANAKEAIELWFESTH
jgi:predicted RNase H-like HicB family nuclease